VARLIYSGIMSLDGYTADAGGGFDWAEPDEEVHAYVNDLERPIGTYLYGRRMYDTMAVWQSMAGRPDLSPASRDYAQIWQGADKVVYSTTLTEPSTPRTRVERSFDPDAVRTMKESAAADISVGGPGLASQAVAAGLVDEWHLFVTPVVVGGGTRYLPGGVRLDLDLLDERRFGNGVVLLRYRTRA
jgi:dihydrofolate reductase